MDDLCLVLLSLNFADLLADIHILRERFKSNINYNPGASLLLSGWIIIQFGASGGFGGGGQTQTDTKMTDWTEK